MKKFIFLATVLVASTAFAFSVSRNSSETASCTCCAGCSVLDCCIDICQCDVGPCICGDECCATDGCCVK